MATGRVSAIRLIAPPASSKGRVSAVRITGTPVAGSKGRVSAVRLTGTLPTGIKGRVSGIRLHGAIALTLAPFLPRTAEPLTSVDVTAVLTGGTATGYTFRVVSTPVGVTVALTGTGATRTFRTPGLVGGGVIVLGVVATNGTAASPEVTVSITVLPQIPWVRFHDGLGWRPGKYIL